jgi:phage repressor protein C with HTH and peptisase S24 domain
MNTKDKNLARIDRLKSLLDTHFNGQKDELGKFLGYKDGAFVRQMLSGSRPISEKTVDKITSIRKFNNWFGSADVLPKDDATGIKIANMQYPDNQELDINNQPNDIVITQYNDVAGSMGRGLILQDQPGEISSIRVNEEWVRKNVRHYSSIQNLCIVTGFGDSMRGMYNPGDPLLVDSGVKTIDFDGVYFFRIGEEGFIKTLQRIPGVGIRAISENKKYEAWTITKDMEFEVLARVIKVWESTDF